MEAMEDLALAMTISKAMLFMATVTVAPLNPRITYSEYQSPVQTVATISMNQKNGLAVAEDMDTNSLSSHNR